MEFPQIDPLYEKLKDKGFVIMGIDAFNMTEQGEKFLAENEIGFPCFENGKDDAEVVSKVFGVNIFPTSMLVDKNGKVRYLHIGFEEGDEVKLEEQIMTLLNE